MSASVGLVLIKLGYIHFTYTMNISLHQIHQLYSLYVYDVYS